ncbi:PLAC8 family-domain-containing protein [Lasiosphaeria hispida]|uniref:PLAC8 family-domain-containing protein n=1 Tax=Lasiosphaeria hispida TaxID=260671 RepID=A0AAJ0HF04_9PEZI|nr:PLAC8 family-domain-containing protein [Lasiosphaeria hispida]
MDASGHPSAPAPATHQKAGLVDNDDVADWKARVNEVLARPGEHINSSSPESAQPWSATFFGCCSPIDTCLITWCLPCVTFGKTHHRVRKDGNLKGYEAINTTCLLFCGSALFGLHWIPMSMQRANIREKYNLQGNCLVDIATACCCGLCDLVQQDKEAAYRELNHGAVQQQYQTNGGMSYPADHK